MSIEENKNIVRRYQEAYNQADYESLAEVVSENLLTPNIASGMPFGLEGAIAVHQKTLLGMPDYLTTIEDLIAEGDKVVARVNKENCIKCNLCYIACEDGAHQCFSFDNKKFPVVDEVECVGCNLCALVCPSPGAISMAVDSSSVYARTWASSPCSL